MKVGHEAERDRIGFSSNLNSILNLKKCDTETDLNSADEDDKLNIAEHPNTSSDSVLKPTTD